MRHYESETMRDKKNLLYLIKNNETKSWRIH